MTTFLKRIERDNKIIDDLGKAALKMEEKINLFLFDNDIFVTKYVPNIAPPLSEVDLANYLRA